MALPEAWLRGPLPGIDPLLQPAAHALVQAGEDLEHAADGLDTAQLWRRPGGAASVGFHLRHVAGSIDRLLAHARGEQLSPELLRAIPLEQEPGSPPVEAGALVRQAQAAIARALDQLRNTPNGTLLQPRGVGRSGLPSTVLGLLGHLAEHTQRHAGQIITTAKIVRHTLAPVPALIDEIGRVMNGDP